MCTFPPENFVGKVQDVVECDLLSLCLTLSGRTVSSADVPRSSSLAPSTVARPPPSRPRLILTYGPVPMIRKKGRERSLSHKKVGALRGAAEGKETGRTRTVRKKREGEGWRAKRGRCRRIHMSIMPCTHGQQWLPDSTKKSDAGRLTKLRHRPLRRGLARG